MASSVLWWCVDFRRACLRTANNKLANYAQSESLGESAIWGGSCGCFETFFVFRFPSFFTAGTCVSIRRYSGYKLFSLQIACNCMRGISVILINLIPASMSLFCSLFYCCYTSQNCS